MKTFFRSIAGFILFAQCVWATTVVKMELPEIVQKSDRIVEGVVESVESRWDAERKLAFTYVSFRVDEEFKGVPARNVTLKLLGGTVGALNVTVAGMPRFTPRQRAIVFLRSQPGAMYDLVGLNQGVYEVVGDFAVSDLSGVELIDPKNGAITKPVSTPKTSLSEFKQKIRQAIQQEKR